MSGVSYLFFGGWTCIFLFFSPTCVSLKMSLEFVFFGGGEIDLLGWFEGGGKGQLIGNTNAASEEKDKRLRFPTKKIHAYEEKKRRRKNFFTFSPPLLQYLQ